MWRVEPVLAGDLLRRLNALDDGDDYLHGLQKLPLAATAAPALRVFLRDDDVALDDSGSNCSNLRGR